MNKVIVQGYISNDTELSYTQNTQTAICKFNVAVNRGKDKNGNDLGADFVPCKAIGKTAEIIDKYFHKGKPILVEGKFTVDRFQNKDGGTSYYTYCKVDKFEFVPQESQKGMDDVQEPVEEDVFEDGFAEVEESLPF